MISSEAKDLFVMIPNRPVSVVSSSSCMPYKHCGSIVWCSTGTQIKSQAEFRRAGSLIPFVVRTRCSQRLPSRVIVARLWWLSAGRCSQLQFKQGVCLKWLELNRGFDLSLARHENSCTWNLQPLTTTNIYTCIRTCLNNVFWNISTFSLLKMSNFLLGAHTLRYPSNKYSWVYWWSLLHPVNKMTPVINGYILDWVIYCSVWQSRASVIRGIVSLWRVTSKTCWLTTRCSSAVGNPDQDHILLQAMHFWWKTTKTFAAHYKMFSRWGWRPEQRGWVITARTSCFMFLRVGGSGLSSGATFPPGRWILCFGWCWGVTGGV